MGLIPECHALMTDPVRRGLGWGMPPGVGRISPRTPADAGSLEVEVARGALGRGVRPAPVRTCKTLFSAGLPCAAQPQCARVP